jgi:hypothetical protein
MIRRGELTDEAWARADQASAPAAARRPGLRPRELQEPVEEAGRPARHP